MERKQMIVRITDIINESSTFEIELLNMLIQPKSEGDMFKTEFDTTKLICVDNEEISNCMAKCDIFGCLGCEALETIQ